METKNISLAFYMRKLNYLVDKFYKTDEVSKELLESIETRVLDVKKCVELEKGRLNCEGEL